MSFIFLRSTASSSSPPPPFFGDLATAKLPSLNKKGITDMVRNEQDDLCVTVYYSACAGSKKDKHATDLATKVCRTMSGAQPFVIVLLQSDQTFWFYKEEGSVKKISSKDFGDDEFGREHKSVSSFYQAHPKVTTVTLQAIAKSEGSRKKERGCLFFGRV